MSFSHALERLRAAIDPRSEARRGGGGERIVISARDLADLLDDHAVIDARLRTVHFHANRPGYPPRVEMLARAASDPGAFAGYKGDRSMGRWIADAILAIEHQQSPIELQKIVTRMHQISVRFGKTRGEISYALDEGAAELLNLSAEVERLRRILARYGDRVPMANCHRADWQHTIDEALEWVANNPEAVDLVELSGGSNG